MRLARCNRILENMITSDEMNGISPNEKSLLDESSSCLARWTLLEHKESRFSRYSYITVGLGHPPATARLFAREAIAKASRS